MSYIVKSSSGIEPTILPWNEVEKEKLIREKNKYLKKENMRLQDENNLKNEYLKKVKMKSMVTENCSTCSLKASLCSSASLVWVFQSEILQARCLQASIFMSLTFSCVRDSRVFMADM